MEVEALRRIIMETVLFRVRMQFLPPRRGGYPKAAWVTFRKIPTPTRRPVTFFPLFYRLLRHINLSRHTGLRPSLCFSQTSQNVTLMGTQLAPLIYRLRACDSQKSVFFCGIKGENTRDRCLNATSIFSENVGTDRASRKSSTGKVTSIEFFRVVILDPTSVETIDCTQTLRSNALNCHPWRA